MAPPFRLIGLVALAGALAACTAPAPSPPPTPPVASTVPAAATSPVPADTADALAAVEAAHSATRVDTDSAQRLWLRRGATTIEAAGTYLLRGWSSGHLVVDAGWDPVVLVLDGLQLRSRDAAAIEVRSPGPVVVVAAEGSDNSLEVQGDHPAISSRGRLTVQGTGSLSIDSEGDGITGRSGVLLTQGSLRVNAAADGVRAGGYLVVDDTTLTVAADGDGLRADGDPGSGSGYVLLRDPFLTVNAGRDGVRSVGDIIVPTGALEIRTAGGHQSSLEADARATALRAGRHLVVDDGSFDLDAADDGGNAAQAVVVNGGDWRIAAGDDGLHGDQRLVVTGGEVLVTAATEGVEGETIDVAGGRIDVTASDDALNASEAELPLATPSITISAGSLRLDTSGGDGLDSNGDVTMTGGELTILGAPVDNESAIDYDGQFLISGGSLVAAGGAGMAQPPSGGSEQRSLWFDVAGREGTLVEFVGAQGEVVAGFTGVRRFGTVVVSNPDIEAGREYTVRVDGTDVGTTTTAAADEAPRRFPRRR